MHALDLYKSRSHSEVKLADGKTYKIPNEFTVDEVERVLELQIERDALEKQEAKDGAVTPENAEFKHYMDLVFMQLEVLFQHHQPEVTAEFLKSAMTQNEALEALGFFQKYRHIAVRDYLANKNQPADADSKKKVSAKTELRDLRRLITFMVVEGFSLSDLRKLYIDEIYSYYEQLIYTMEKAGKVTKGSYAKIVKRSKGDVDAATQLRKGMMVALATKGRK